mgnify:FL=1
MDDILTIKPLPSRTIIPSILNIIIFYGIIFLAYSLFISLGSEIIKLINSTLNLNLGFILGVTITFFFLSTIISLILKYLRIKNTTFEISKKSVTYNQEFISINKTSIPTSQITNTDSFISFFWDKIFKTGTLNVYTSGSSSVDMVLSNIYDVDKMYHKIQEHIQANKNNSTSDLGASNTIKTSSKPLLSIKPNVKLAVISTILPLIPAGFFLVIPFSGILLSFVIGIYTQTNLLLSIIGLVVLLSIIGGVLIGIPFYSYKYYSNISYYFYEDKVEYFDGFFLRAVKKQSLHNFW